MPKKHTAFRIDTELIDWLNDSGENKTKIVEFALGIVRGVDVEKIERIADDIGITPAHLFEVTAWFFSVLSEKERRFVISKYHEALSIKLSSKEDKSFFSTFDIKPSKGKSHKSDNGSE